MSIAPNHSVQALLYLDQADRNDVSAQTDVGLMFDHLPGRVFRGKITNIASAHTDFVPPNMAT